MKQLSLCATLTRGSVHSMKDPVRHREDLTQPIQHVLKKKRSSIYVIKDRRVKNNTRFFILQIRAKIKKFANKA